jgi:hypothetical protein
VDRIVQLLEAIYQRMGSQSAGTHSVEIRTSTRGVDIIVKAYTTSTEVPVSEAGDAAMDEYLRLTTQLTARLMGQ